MVLSEADSPQRFELVFDLVVHNALNYIYIVGSILLPQLSS